MKKIIIIIFIVITTNAYCIENNILLNTVDNLYQISQEYLKKNEAANFVIIYNTYKLITKDVYNRSQLKKYDDYFKDKTEKNKDVLPNVIVSPISEPVVINNNGASGGIPGWRSIEIPTGWKSDEALAFQALLNNGITPSQLYANGYGKLDNPLLIEHISDESDPSLFYQGQNIDNIVGAMEILSKSGIDPSKVRIIGKGKLPNVLETINAFSTQQKAEYFFKVVDQ